MLIASCVGIGKSQRVQHAYLAPLHAARIRVALVIETQQMQSAVHDQVRPVRREWTALHARLGAQQRRTDHQIPQQAAGAPRRKACRK